MYFTLEKSLHESCFSLCVWCSVISWSQLSVDSPPIALILLVLFDEFCCDCILGFFFLEYYACRIDIACLCDFWTLFSKLCTLKILKNKKYFTILFEPFWTGEINLKFHVLTHSSLTFVQVMLMYKILKHSCCALYPKFSSHVLA